MQLLVKNCVNSNGIHAMQTIDKQMDSFYMYIDLTNYIAKQ